MLCKPTLRGAISEDNPGTACSRSITSPPQLGIPVGKGQIWEYQDSAFLKACGLEHLSHGLRAFWPRGGPMWDALASIEFQKDKNSNGILLAEAKSYPAEIYGNGCMASPRSRKKIETALNKTKIWCGVSRDIDWTGPLYQSANRMAHLYFFRKIAGVPAWLANVYFLNDPHSPTDHLEWQKQLKKSQNRIGNLRRRHILYG